MYRHNLGVGKYTLNGPVYGFKKIFGRINKQPESPIIIRALGTGPMWNRRGSKSLHCVPFYTF